MYEQHHNKETGGIFKTDICSKSQQQQQTKTKNVKALRLQTSSNNQTWEDSTKELKTREFTRARHHHQATKHSN
jgi:hypothetical protein